MNQSKEPLNLDYGQKLVGVVAVNSIDFVKTVFDCFNKNQIVVFLNSPQDNYKITATGVTEIITPQSEFGWSAMSFSPNVTESIAQISFTSGTTGKPKGVILKHTALNDVVDRLIDIMEIDSSIREYIGVPVNYSFGFGRCRVVAKVNGEFYIPEHGFNPLEIRDMLLAGSINAISAVPSLWRALFQCEEIFGKETHQVKWIEIGSQYMSRAEKEKLRKIFPKANIVQHYGLTEASRSTFLRVDQTEGEYLESVGKAYGQTEIQISAENKIMIKGPHVAENLIVDGVNKTNVDLNGWHETSDLGKIDNGYLYYLGRSDDLINCGGVKVSPENIEKSIRESLNIQSGIAVARVNDQVRGDAILVGILNSAELDIQQVKNVAIQAALQQNIQSADAIKVMEFEEFPTTATGKIQRNQLSQLYDAKIQTLSTAHHLKKPLDKLNTLSEEENIELSDSEKEIITIWQSVLSVENINVNNNFFEIGGDSLTAISVMFRMEKMGIPKQIAQGMLQGLTVKDLAKIIDKSHDPTQVSHTISNEYTRTSMNINIIRGILVLCVIIAHWSEGIFARLTDSVQVLQILSPTIFSIGTPGFAIIYGVSAGYSMFNIFKTNQKRLNKILYTTFLLLASGILLLGLLKFTENLVSGEVKSFTDFTNSFYSVLTYYLLITATLPLWFSILGKSKNPISQSIFLSVISYCLYHYWFAHLTQYRAEGFVELAKLMIAAKYSYFNLLAGTLAGVAIGMIIRQRVEKKDTPIPYNFVWIGLAFISSAIVIASHANMTHTWFVWPLPTTYIWGWLFYIGLILIGLSLTNQLLLSYNKFSPSQKLIWQSFSTIGILAFPLFISHEIVLPLKNIMVSFGIPNSLSLIVVMLLFIVAVIFMFKKIYNANFTW